MESKDFFYTLQIYLQKQMIHNRKAQVKKQNIWK